MRARAVATLLLSACVATAAADDTATVQVEVGGVAIELPAPSGQVAIKDERLRKFIEAMVPAENRHLASYAPAADIERAGTGASFSRWASVHTVREVESLALREADFVIIRGQMLAAWNDQLAQVAQLVSDEFVKSSERVREAINVDMQFAASDIVPVEVVADEPDAFSTMLLLRSEVKSQGQTIATKLIATTTMMCVADRLVVLYYYDQHRSDADIAAARDATRAWIASVRSVNTAP